ncbi:hypothetical protein [Kitasatospora sp. NBC_01302]|uniref:hypothetical protein n=1 Tax=Kitasatospora sp. NBC_01302 TaxID=2903575 RepID=UPI002E124A53|nr:hypothetical protein OG294_14395 [Kitasatospora sp. NBC_01302]
MADSPVPLASVASLVEGPFADLVRSYSTQAQQDLMIEATRACEGHVGRRLAPFTQLPESHRAEGIDPDEYADSANLPMDIQGTLGRSYAMALGASSLVRHVWLNEYAPRHAEYWQYANLNISLIRSYGGTQSVTGAQLLTTSADTGHVFFQLGLFLPIGTTIQISYDGGYQTIPADLARACKYMAGSIAVTELDPTMSRGHDPDILRGKAEDLLDAFMRA